MPGPRRTDFKKPKNAKKTFGRILQYAGKSKFMLLAVFVMLIASTVCSVGASYWLKPILNDIDASIRAGNFATVGVQSLMRNLAIVSALYIGASLCTYIQSKVMVKIAYKTTNLIRKELFDHMQTLPLRFFDTQTHGEIMSRYTNDVDNIQMMLEQSMVQLVSSAFTFVGIVVMMIALSPPLFCISLVFMIIMLVTVSKIGKKSKHYFQAQQANLGQMNGNIEESVEGMRVIKVFNHEDQAIAGFDQYNEAFRSAATNANFYAGLMGPVSNGINNAGYALIALFGGLLALTGRLDIGTFFTFLSYAKQFTQPINQIANQMNTIFSALAGAERVFEMMDTASEEDQGTVTLTVTGAGEEKRWYWQDGDRRVPVHGAVEFHHVTFAYVPEKVVLHDISLYAKEGQKIAFVGSTGAGKTTITNLINRFYDIQEGTIMENIRYGRLDATDEECIAAAKLASAHSFIRRLPEGYQTMLTGDGGNLSQGQRQLLAIARAAVADPPVMVLDEATSSIDTRTEKHIEHGMDRLMAGKTTFVIAHRLSTVRESNAIMVLEDGRIIERGDHNALMAQQGRYYQLCTGKAKLS